MMGVKCVSCGKPIETKKTYYDDVKVIKDNLCDTCVIHSELRFIEKYHNPKKKPPNRDSFLKNVYDSYGYKEILTNHIIIDYELIDKIDDERERKNLIHLKENGVYSNE